MSQAGMYFKLDPSSGRFFYSGEIGLGGSPGDGTVCVLSSTADVHALAAMLNANVAVPPGGGRWQVSYQALLNAQVTGTRAVVVPTTS
jgi:hypothetical protein